MTIAEKLLAELHKKPQELLKECIENSVRVIECEKEKNFKISKIKYFSFEDESCIVNFDGHFDSMNTNFIIYYNDEYKTIAEHFSR